jgi:hypothetical protein
MWKKENRDIYIGEKQKEDQKENQPATGSGRSNRSRRRGGYPDEGR